ncbi:GNAT family N-acetyltransferase [Streptomyces sp. NPDC001642]|uniref:GNAT family N-acetyltransferase n=1 Tax=Streptomyces sp. NPDC001642 TaxID=3154392 RepID=UPI00333258BC
MRCTSEYHPLDSGVHVLDNPVFASLSNPAHARLARRRGNVLRYLEDVSPFMGLPDHPTEQDWQNAARLLSSGTAGYVHHSGGIPRAWTVVKRLDVLQMTAPADPPGAADERAVRLTAADVPEMLDLAHRTAPGPFHARTIEMGEYLGIRQGGVLIAMAGERMRPAGWTEISAVCTSPEHRGKGLGRSLLTTIHSRITARGEQAFLHVAATNGGAVRLYESLGYEIRHELALTILRRPELGTPDRD